MNTLTSTLYWRSPSRISANTAVRRYSRYPSSFCRYSDRRRIFLPVLIAREFLRRPGRCRAIGLRRKGTPLDHPALEPLYAEAAELDLAVVLHTFTVMPPYAPGGLDTWDNLWLQRSAAHPWCGMRNMAAMIGSGARRVPVASVWISEASPRQSDERVPPIYSALKNISVPAGY